MQMFNVQTRPALGKSFNSLSRNCESMQKFLVNFECNRALFLQKSKLETGNTPADF